MPQAIAHETAHAYDDDAGQDRELDEAIVIQANGTPWVAVAQGDMGLREIRGRQHNDRVVQMFADAGHPYIRDDETAWCAAAMCAWLERAGVPSPKTLAARGFTKWGREIDTPVPGCIVVMWRGSPHGWQGHVGIYMGEAQGGRAIRVLGGNQRNKVSVAEFSKRRKYRGEYYDAVLSYRMPRRVLRTQVAGAANAAVAAASATATAAVAVSTTANEARPVADALVSTGNPAAMQVGLWLGVVLAVVSVGVSAYIYWRRGADHKARGV